jgi:hypothetical protein
MVVLALGFLPAVGAMSASPNAVGCSASWINPSSTYSPGSTVSAYVITNCAGHVDWIIVSEPTGAFVARGSVQCPTTGCESQLFSYTAGGSTLPKGTYQFVSEFNGAAYAFQWDLKSFTVS